VIVPLLLAAAAAAAPPAAPAAEPPPPPEIAEGILPEQRLVQVLHADLDRDGHKEWIAIGEPMKPKDAGKLSIAIFDEVKGKPRLQFREYVMTKQCIRAGAIVRDVPPAGPVVVFVAADPDRVANDSTFTLQIYGKRKGHYQNLLPEQPRFASQGGFSFEDRKRDTPGLELVVWTYLLDEGEDITSPHRYALNVFHFQGGRWVGQDRRTHSEEKYASYSAAAQGLKIKNPDLRRQIPRIDEVP
jgi:hypothetical protein